MLKVIYDIILVEVFSEIRSNNVLHSLAQNTGKRYRAVVSGSCLLPFLERGQTWAFLINVQIHACKANYFCESSCLFYLNFNFDFYVSKIMHL